MTDRTLRGSELASTTRGADRHIRAGADRQPHVRAGERGSVVHAVTHHRGDAALLLEALDGGRLILRAHVGEDAVDAQFCGHRPCDGLRIAGDHRDVDPAIVERVDRRSRLRAHLVLDAQCADDDAVCEHVQDGRPCVPPRSRRVERLTSPAS